MLTDYALKLIRQSEEKKLERIRQMSKMPDTKENDEKSEDTECPKNIADRDIIEFNRNLVSLSGK